MHGAVPHRPISNEHVSVKRRGPSYAITDPADRTIKIPANIVEDETYFTPDQRDDIRRYYHENGYVVVRNLIPRGLCSEAMRRFKAEVHPHDGFIYRQTTANPERHVFTAHGFMLNPILNVQSLDPRYFPRFRETSLDVLTHANVQAVVAKILGEPGKLMQSMYFEGNPLTWAHQDTYYQDAEQIGGATAGWFAVEDIAPGAGRFCIFPKSHLVDLARNGGDFDVAYNHDRYKKLVVDTIRRHGLECRAPALQQGDALFWTAKTMHGSLQTTQPRYSRSSFTAHYIPDSSRYLQFQCRFRHQTLSMVNGIRVHSPKDLKRPSRRLLFWIEANFPRPFQTVKKLAIKVITR